MWTAPYLYFFSFLLDLVVALMEKPQVDPQMKVAMKIKRVKMVLLDAALTEEHGPKDQTNKVALNVLMR